MSKSASKVTIDHDEIRNWAEQRKAVPACVRGTGGSNDVGMIRLDFPGFSGAKSLEPLEWDEWFEKFDKNGLALLYQETTAEGEQSNFNKLVSRETMQGAEESRGRSSGASKSGASRNSVVGRKTAAKSSASKSSTAKRKTAGGTAAKSRSGTAQKARKSARG
jgi:hypothetical protein